MADVEVILISQGLKDMCLHDMTVKYMICLVLLVVDCTSNTCRHVILSLSYVFFVQCQSLTLYLLHLFYELYYLWTNSVMSKTKIHFINVDRGLYKGALSLSE